MTQSPTRTLTERWPGRDRKGALGIRNSGQDFDRRRHGRPELCPKQSDSSPVSHLVSDANNANQFFGLFGSEFRSTMTERMKKSDDMQSSVEAFLELGNERNRLVHQNYATFPMEKTLDEIYALYQSAVMFVDDLPAALRDCDGDTKLAS